MFVFKILAYVFLVSCVTITNIKCEKAGHKVEENVEDNAVDLLEDHTFVALIDIVFTDGSKRTCTGSIIHDNVVITAAHCFTKDGNRDVIPELTVSFVVIGSKRMFDSGYEQYLPIERVLTHPGFNEWNADLSLVFTFAAMTSDKPGKIIPIASRSSVNSDSNLTVLSWGKIKESTQNDLISKQEKTEESGCSDSTSEEDRKEEKNDGAIVVTAILRSKKHHRVSNKVTASKIIHQRVSRRKTENKLDQLKVTPKTKVISRYLSREERESMQKQKLQTIQNIMRTKQELSTETNKHKDKYNRKSAHRKMNNIKSYYKNWRRVMGTQHNKLNVEVFRLVDIRECKRLIKKAEIDDLNTLTFDVNIVCYTAHNSFISDKDSGAPVVVRGQLLAVTVGGVEYDGEYLAVGMKMSCYCSWVAEHLPNGGERLDCARNCSDVDRNEHKEEKDHKHKKDKKKTI